MKPITLRRLAAAIPVAAVAILVAGGRISRRQRRSRSRRTRSC